jgi:hypothetical protein
MVGIRVVESENWRKEENATKPKMLGKNFLAKSKDCSETRRPEAAILEAEWTIRHAPKGMEK